jgi:3-deoxy-D-manno-octulosonate 8-phosphate phosphatase (KDO 8-P phosphatase)
MTPSARARARRVRLLVMDVDGVLTDGRMVLSARGDETKAFHTRDGIAIELARRGGLRTAMVTGEKSPIARIRGDKLRVDAIVLGARRKGETLTALCARFGVPLAAVAYVGDDLLDLPALQRAGLALAVADAAPEVRAAAHFVTRAPGGSGAVREIVEAILRARGGWRAAVDGFVRDHGGRALGRSSRRRPARRPRR